MPRLRLLDADVPFKPGNRPFYYGWWVLMAIVVAGVLSAPGQTAGVSPFIEHLMGATGLTRQALANAYLVGTLLSGCCIPFAGKLLDSWGSRRVVILSGLCLSAVLVMVSRVDSVFVLGYPMLGLALLCAGFFLMRFSGQGLMTLAGQTTAPRWFKRRRGMAMGVVGFVAAIMAPVAPLLLNIFIEIYGWRGAWVAAAVIVAGVNTLVVWLLWRDTPEQCGLHIDGRAPDPHEHDEEVGGTAWTRREAITQPSFYLVMFTQALMGLIVTAASFHVVDLGAMRGLSEKASLAFFLPMTWTAMVVGLTANFLADHVSYRAFLPTMQALLAAAVLLLVHLKSATGFYAGAMMLGLGIAMAGPVSVTTFPRWFGRVHLGAITGVNWAGVVIGSAIGPALFSFFRTDEGYLPAAWICAVLLAVLFVATWLIGPPPPKQA